MFLFYVINIFKDKLKKKYIKKKTTLDFSSGDKKTEIQHGKYI